METDPVSVSTRLQTCVEKHHCPCTWGMARKNEIVVSIVVLGTAKEEVLTVIGTTPLRVARSRFVPGQKIRALVVDDSVVIRRLVTRMLDSDPAITVIGSARDGLEALTKVEQLSPDIVTLDVEMPNLDGLGTLRLLQERYPMIRVVMFSSLTERGAAATIDALLAGASDYVTKQHCGEMSTSAYDALKEELSSKIKRLFLPPELAPSSAANSARNAATVAPRSYPLISGSTGKDGMSYGSRPTPQILAIGVSTGGPSALAELLPMIPANFALPVVIVQHMPPLFTQMLAERLTKLSRIPVCEGRDGMEVRPGTAIVAPGNFHMRLVRRLKGIEVVLNQEERENSCRPAVDVLFRSIAEVYGGSVMAVILTGMGHDGLLGVRQLKALGASVIVQDQATSVVWGMPGAVAEASLADLVLPLQKIIPAIVGRV